MSGREGGKSQTAHRHSGEEFVSQGYLYCRLEILCFVLTGEDFSPIFRLIHLVS